MGSIQQEKVHKLLNQTNMGNLNASKVHSGFFCKKLFYKKLGSNSEKFKKFLRNWWGWDPQIFETWGLRFSWLTWDDIDDVKVTNGLSTEEKMSLIWEFSPKLSNMFK